MGRRRNESLFEASWSHAILVSFHPISNIDKKIIEYVSSHTENSAERLQAFYKSLNLFLINCVN